jgi:ankyrin repeat protein
VIDGCRAESDGVNYHDAASGGNTALCWAAYFNEVEVLLAILAAPGVDITASNQKGNTALHLAAVSDSIGAVNVS